MAQRNKPGRPGVRAILLACGLAVGLMRGTARADYPDYAPPPPLSSADRDERPAAYADEQPPAERYPRAQIQLPNELRPNADPRSVDPRAVEARPAEVRPADAMPPAQQGEPNVGPRPMAVRFQPVDYQAPVSATQPMADTRAATENAPPNEAPQQAGANQPNAFATGGVAAEMPVTTVRIPGPDQAAQPGSIPLIPQSPLGRGGFRADVPPWLAGAGSLGIVLGLFLMVAWAMRRGMPKNVALLPREAVEVLGRAPLVGREHVYLVRCANKIVLVSFSANKMEKLTEISDPAEVDRLAGICQQMNPHSVTASFRQVFQQFGNPPAERAYLARRQAEEMDFGELDEVGHYPVRETRI